MVNLPFFQNTNKKTTKFLSLNINSKDVRCLAFYPTDDLGNSKDLSFKIIGSGRQDLEKGAVRNGAFIDKNAVIEAAKIAVAEAMENIEDDAREVIFGVGGNISLGLMTTIKYTKPAKGSLEKAEIENIYNKISESSYMQAQNEYLETTGNADVGLENITSADVYIKVDGQTVTSLEDKEGSLVEVASFNAFSPSFHIKMIQEVTHKLGLNIIAIGSETYSLVQWIKERFEDQKDFVLINIDEDTTTVAVVFGGGIAATKNLNIGMAHFVEGVSEKTGVTTSEAEKLLRSYLAEKLSESEATVVQNCLTDLLGIWLSGLELVFAEFSNVKIFPSKVFVGGSGAELKDLTQFLKNEPWTKSVPFKSFPEIAKFNLSDFSKVIDSTGKVVGSDWLSCISMSIVYKEIHTK